MYFVNPTEVCVLLISFVERSNDAIPRGYTRVIPPGTGRHAKVPQDSQAFALFSTRMQKVMQCTHTK